MNISHLEIIKNILLTSRYNLADEKNLQLEIANSFTGHIDFRREVRLSPTETIDFMVEDIGIEIKINGSAKKIYRQCERYCACDQVQMLILVTNKIMRLPSLINNKTTFVINLGNAWL